MTFKSVAATTNRVGSVQGLLHTYRSIHTLYCPPCQPACVWTHLLGASPGTPTVVDVFAYLLVQGQGFKPHMSSVCTVHKLTSESKLLTWVSGRLFQWYTGYIYKSQSILAWVRPSKLETILES